MKEKIVIIGTSSTAYEVYEFIKGYDLYDVVGFAVDKQYKAMDVFCGLPVFELDILHEVYKKEDIKLFVAILWNRLNADRRYLYERLKAEGYNFVNLISPTARIRGALLGDNCWIHDYVVIQPGAKIAEDNMFMAFSLVGASSQIGAHCFMGTKSTVAGGCKIGEQCFIGINCTIFDDTNIGKKCVLGACSVVKRNIKDYSVVKTDANNMIVKEVGEQDIENKLLFRKNVR